MGRAERQGGRPWPSVPAEGGRVISLANIWGTEMPHLEAKLNELGPEGWDAIHVYNPCNTGITPAVAKRPLTETARGQRPGAYESLG